MQLSHYLKPSIVRIFLLGIASGFPWVLIGTLLTLWLKDLGVSRASIGYAGAIFGVYSINFVWAPLVDRLAVDRLVKPLGLKLGRRKGWIALAQLVMIATCGFIMLYGELGSARYLVGACLFIALASATQDIAIDAYRIDIIPQDDSEQIAYAASAAFAGWHTGYYGLAALILIAVERLEWLWSQAYLASALIFAALLIHTVLMPEPNITRKQQQSENVQHYLNQITKRSDALNVLTLLCIVAPIGLVFWAFSGSVGLPSAWRESVWHVPGMLAFGFAALMCGLGLLHSDQKTSTTHTTTANSSERVLAHIASAVITPLTDFFVRNGKRVTWIILAFIVTFKLGEAFLGRMSLVFYKEVGFTNEDIALYSKLVSWVVTVVFSIISGWVTAKFGLLRGLFIAGIAMAASNLMFSAIAVMGPVKWMFALTVVVDGFTAAWSSVAFVAFISALCNQSFSATQYALLASLGTLGRTFIGSSSGQLVDVLGGNWALFFIITALLVIPGLMLLFILSKLGLGGLGTKTGISSKHGDT